MDAGEGKQTGDVVSASKKGSAAEEFYRYSLLEKKLENIKKARDGAGVDPLLTIQSEREAIEMSILQNLINITESSPEFAQVVDITGSRDRYEQARILSEVVYDKVRAEQILNFYTPKKSDLETHFANRTLKSLDARLSGQATASRNLNVANEASGVESATARISALFLPAAASGVGSRRLHAD